MIHLSDIDSYLRDQWPREAICIYVSRQQGGAISLYNINGEFYFFSNKKNCLRRYIEITKHERILSRILEQRTLIADFHSNCMSLI
jgi:hypothetical protein